jgi:hypothetical protein
MFQVYFLNCFYLPFMISHVYCLISPSKLLKDFITMPLTPASSVSAAWQTRHSQGASVAQAASPFVSSPTFLNTSTADSFSFSQTHQNQPHFEGGDDSSPNATKQRKRIRVKSSNPTAIETRRAQNRLSQRTYRAKKDNRIKELETQVGKLETQVGKLETQVNKLRLFIASRFPISVLEELLGTGETKAESPKSQKSNYNDDLDAEGHTDYEDDVGTSKNDAGSSQGSASNTGFYQHPNHSNTKVTEFLVNDQTGNLFEDPPGTWWQKVKEGNRHQKDVYVPFRLLSLEDNTQPNHS